MGYFFILLNLIACNSSKDSNYQIVFEDDGLITLVTQNGDGLLPTFSGDFPEWSPDGTQILFGRGVENHYQLFFYNIATKETSQLTNNPAHGYLYPYYSPTGQNIIYWDEMLFRRLNPLTGDDIVLLDSQYYSSPSLSTLDTAVAFVSTQDGQPDIYKMTIQMTGKTRLTTNPDLDLNPKWSPKGDKIAFFTNRDNARHLYIMNPDGSNQQDVTVVGNIDFDWFPDGSGFAFVVNDEIYTINVDGSGIKRLTYTEVGVNDRPRVSRDGKYIVFEHVQGFYGSEIQVIGTNGKGLKTISHEIDGRWPSWARWSPIKFSGD